MNLAVCDDNIADRKQTERLLGRESDRIFKLTGERLFIDSYGNAEAFLHNPQMYHGLFIDMVGSPNGFEILKELLSINIVKPIVMLSSSLDFRKMVDDAGIEAPNLLFLEKPIKVLELRNVMGRIQDLNKVVTPTLELRGIDDTVYAREEEIICVEKVRSELLVHLTEGRKVSVIADILNFYDECNIFPSICPVNDNVLVNVNHVVKTSFGKAHLDNGMVMKVSLTYRNAIKITRERIKEGS